jgi:hypothetical protein
MLEVLLSIVISGETVTAMHEKARKPGYGAAVLFTF